MLLHNEGACFSSQIFQFPNCTHVTLCSSNLSSAVVSLIPQYFFVSWVKNLKLLTPVLLIIAIRLRCDCLLGQGDLILGIALTERDLTLRMVHLQWILLKEANSRTQSSLSIFPIYTNYANRRTCVKRWKKWCSHQLVKHWHRPFFVNILGAIKTNLVSQFRQEV